MNFHPKAGVRLVGTKAVHRFLPVQTGEWRWHIDPQGFLHDLLDQAFGHFLDFFGRGEAHFRVNLGKFWLAVPPQVFVPEATRHLVVTIHPGGHQQLLKQLR